LVNQLKTIKEIENQLTKQATNYATHSTLFL